jgi:O-antigen/teichoic acid export membrane protein
MQLGLRRNSIWAIAEVLFSGLTLFVLYRIIVKQLGVEALGIWSVVMATTSLGSLADIGTAAGLGRFVAASNAKNEEDKAIAFAETAILTNLVLYLGIAAIIWCPAYYWLGVLTSGESLLKARQLLPFALISFILMSVTAAATGSLVGQQRSDQKSKVVIASLVTQFVVTVLFIKRHGLLALAWAQTAQYLLIICANWTLFLRNHFGLWRFRFPVRWRREAFRELIGYGIKLQAVSIVSFLYGPVVKFLMSSQGGLAALGFYEMAQRLVLQIRQLVVMPNQTLVPTFAHLNECEPEKIEPLYHKAMALTTVFGVPLLAGAALGSPVICALWIGHIEPLFIVFTMLLSVGWFANLLSAPAYLLGEALGQLRWNLYGTIVMTCGSASLAFIFGHIFGTFGVAVPAMTMLGAGSLLTMVMNCRRLEIRLFPFRHDFHALLNEARSFMNKL